jgi:nucleotide-binding universal stress UspA family protein
MRVLVPLSDAETGDAVLAVAQLLASRLGAQVEAVHVSELPDGSVAQRMAANARVPMERVVTDKPVPEALASLLAADDVVLMTLGARDEVSEQRPAGHVALGVATAAGKPVVLVPPMRADAVPPLERLLVPLDGAPETTQALRTAMQMFGGSDVEVVGLHVFQDGTVPRFWDKPDHEEAVWSGEFAARNVVAPGARVELRLGSPAQAVIDLTGHEHPGLIALAWSQQLASGRAGVVSEVLRRCRVPVLLVPVASSGVRTFVTTDRPDRGRDC